jgi:hypothetical protein
MNTRTVTFVLFFAALMVAPRIVEPAYYGYLVAFAILAGLQCQWNAIPIGASFTRSISAIAVACLVLVIVGVTLINAPALRDLLRDLGALFAFFVGRYLFVAYRDKGLQTQALHAVSAMGVMVAVVTLVAAALALQAGVSAFVWRGEYVPWAHSWLPYALVANVFLIDAEREHARGYLLRAVLCAAGTIASLSRTDLLLELFFGLVLVYRFRRQIFTRITGFTKLMGALVILAVIVPLVLRLQVVQQRVETGVGEQDASLGWRFMEHVALFEHFQSGTVYDALFGFGLGARLPLPPGVVDFNDNTSIPHLHNSFGTILLKFGLLGLAFLAWYLWRTWRRSVAIRSLPGEAYRRTGFWIVLLCLGKALTLQGLSEWSHIVFFGIGCMLMLSRPLQAYRLIDAHPGERGVLAPHER